MSEKNFIEWPESELRREEDSFRDYATDIRKLLFRSAAFRTAADAVVKYGLCFDGEEPPSWDATDFSRNIGKVGLGACQWSDLSFAVGNLYRHHVELLLKVVILLGRRLDNRKSGFPNKHDLELLWNEARQSITQHANINLQRVKDADNRILALAAQENATYEYRYPKPGSEFDANLPSRDELRDLACPLGDLLAECVRKMWEKRLSQRLST